MSVMARTKENLDCTAHPSKVQPGLCTDFPVISLTLQKLSPVFHVTDFFFFFWMANFDCFISFISLYKGDTGVIPILQMRKHRQRNIQYSAPKFTQLMSRGVTFELSGILAPILEKLRMDPGGKLAASSQSSWIDGNQRRLWCSVIL